MHKQTIALVDDDRNILTSLSIALEKEGFKVQTYIDGETALIGLTRTPPDLAIIDIKMPKMDGEELLKKLRKKTSMPVIFLTSKDEEVDELLGLKLDFVYGEPSFYAGLYSNDLEIHIINENSSNARQPAGKSNLSILVDEVDNLYDNLKERGVEILIAPEDRDYGLRDFSCTDPDGNIFNFGVEVD